MTVRKYQSRSQKTALTSPITSIATTMTVSSPESLVVSTVPSGATFTVVIDPDTSLEEIVDVINWSSGPVLTINRNIDGSTGVAHSAGAVVRHMAIGRDYREANEHIEASTSVHGVTGSVVGTGGTQTLTNKTLISPTITSPTITGTGAIAGTFTGNLTGNVTGTVSGNAGTVTNGVYTTDTGTVTSAMIADATIVNADISASAGIVDTKLATIATGGKVSNSATTATAANTADTIVARDASGNFVAGTITGNLTGNVTGALSGNASTVTNGVYTTDTGTVTSLMLANGTIVDADVNASAALAYSKLNLNGTITSADIVDGTIINTDINATAAIAWTKIATSATVSEIELGYVDGVTSSIQTQLDARLPLAGGTMSGAIAMGTNKITGLGAPTANTTDAATTAYVDTQIGNLVNGAPGILDTLGEIATQIQSGGTFYDSLVLKSGSTMTGALTLSGAPTTNLHAATKLYVDDVAGSAAAAAASAAAAEATYDNFDDRYLGAKTTAPTLDNDGNALITGAIYWNSVSAAMFAWTGSAWGSISSTAAIYRYKFIATGGETSVSGTDALSQTLSYLPGKEQVYLNGVLLVRTTDYTATTGSSVTGLAALAASDILEIITFTAFALATAIENTIIDAKGDLIVGTAADTVGRLAVGTDGYYLQTDPSTATGLKWSAVSGYTAPTLGSTVINSGATVTTISGLTDIVLNGAGSVQDNLTLLLMGAL